MFDSKSENRDRAVEAVEAVSARREQFSCCRGESMSSSCRSLEAERAWGGAIREMVHLDPGPEPSHKQEDRL